MTINKRTIVLLAIGALVMILAAWGMTQSREATMLPQTLGDMELRLYVEGEEAAREVTRIHSSGTVKPGDAYVARYRNYNTDPPRAADVWLTVASSPEKAAGLVEAMTAGMGGSMMFSPPEVLEINGQTIYYTEGTGQYHYYYARDSKVVWIGLSDPDVTYQKEIISIALEKI